MSYIYYFLSILALLFFIDILLVLSRLKTSGVYSAYKLIFHNVGYRRSSPALQTTSYAKTVLIVGDSTAVGPGASPEETIAGRLANTFHVNILNLAVNGARTANITEQINSILGKKFCLTIVHAGNNDIWRLTKLVKLKSDIDSLLNKAKLTSDNVILFRGGNVGSFPIFPLTLGWVYEWRSKKVGKLFKEIADAKSILYVEKFMKRKDDIFLKNWPTFYCWDLLHLNGRGYKIWFDYLLKEMRESNMHPFTE